MTNTTTTHLDLVEDLRASGLDPAPFISLAERLRSGNRVDADNRLRGEVVAPTREEIPALPASSDPLRVPLAERGHAALEKGEVAVVVLAGGMATRFGGTVKALVPALSERTFLDVKYEDVRRVRARVGASVPFLCMTSFATEPAIKSALGAFEDADSFVQFDAPRLAPNGEIFRDAQNATSRYATGHGDLSFALRLRGALEKLRARGVRTLLVSNVDNLTATLDEAVIGAHLSSGRGITVEVAPKEAGDKGGAPAHVDGTLQIVESFRFPESFDQDSIPVFNTNTLVLDLDAIDRDFDLSWFAVTKKVGGAEAYQLERLVGELTTFVPSSYLLVQREGDDARFQPVKEVADLPRQAPLIERALRSRGSLD